MAPNGSPLELVFEAGTSLAFDLPEPLEAIYGGAFGLPSRCLYANFVASLDGVVALAGDNESGQIISGKNVADRFVMGLLRACADIVLLGAGTFRKSAGHVWTAERIYPAAAPLFAELRRHLSLPPAPRLALLSGSGDIDVSQPAVPGAWIFTTPKGEAKLRGLLPSSTRVTAFDAPAIAVSEVVQALRNDGCPRILTEGGPTLFADLVHARLIDQLFLTTSPALFGRFANDGRKSLASDVDLSGSQLDLLGVRRHVSHLFLRYALKK